MKKSMYSLMLADEVVKAVDAMAQEQGTNRSNLINQIVGNARKARRADFRRHRRVDG